MCDKIGGGPRPVQKYESQGCSGIATALSDCYPYAMSESLQRLLSTALIEQLLSLALAKGADFAEIYVERSRNNSIALEEEKIRTASYGVSLGVGIRVIAGSEVGYAYSDDLDTHSLREAAKVAANIARGGKTIAPVRVAQGPRPDRYPILTVPDTIDPRAKVELLLRGDRAAHSHDPRISQVMGVFTDQTKDILIATSDGTLMEDRQVMCRLNFTAIAHDGKGDRRTVFHGGGGRVEFSHYDTFTPELVAREAARMAAPAALARTCARDGCDAPIVRGEREAAHKFRVRKYCCPSCRGRALKALQVSQGTCSGNRTVGAERRGGWARR